MTPNGVEYNLKVSPFIITINYDKNVITFHFSSKMYLEKFENYLKHIKGIQLEKMNKYTGLHLCIAEHLDINYYKSLEKRGFYIVVNNKEKNSILDIKIINNQNLIIE